MTALLRTFAVGLVVVLCGAWLTDWRADRQEVEALKAWPPEGLLVGVQGRQVHAVMRGTGPDLVLIHGASGNLRDMTFRFMDRLADRYRVTAFDRPGLGYTDPAPRSGRFDTIGESPMEQAELLRAAARELGIDRPIVLGHSFGGAVALAWALGDPEGTAAVVDVSGAAMPWPGRLGWLYRANVPWVGSTVVPPLVAAFAPAPLVDRAVEATFAPNPVPDGYAEHLGTGLAIRRASFRENARQVNSLRAHIVEQSRLYAAFPVPLEIVHGEADTIVPPKIHSLPLSRLAPGANLVLLPGVGHMPHHAAPEAVIAAIDRARNRAGL
ncbi:alpha/beta hydrolase [Rubellimicrobium rubrum]|uniref:Alpha/beta hydrolase n=1 Tax=Rubellimicrobium rubrum TaxID=2585369 RepID=A0A5C4MSY1_9RHOB|nr:alpha/beta hydrolase [Rubellimicrobium rubrum]TNC47594.1 alpha/beta hydrolase [Rubellimicrobium rubrum]